MRAKENYSHIREDREISKVHDGVTVEDPRKFEDSLSYRQEDGVQPSLLLAGYAAFQRVAIAFEQVTADLRANGEYRQKLGRFWRLGEMTANRAVEAAYVTLRANVREATAALEAATVPRSIVPERISCLDQESRRNVRDWVILSDSMVIANFYRRLFYHAERRLNIRSGEGRSG